LLVGGLLATAALRAPVEAASEWVFRAAAIPADVAGVTGAAVKASSRGLLGAMTPHDTRFLRCGGAGLQEICTHDILRWSRPDVACAKRG
jgi:hypothetical protein